MIKLNLQWNNLSNKATLAHLCIETLETLYIRH